MPKNAFQDIVKIKRPSPMQRPAEKSEPRNFIKIPKELKGPGERRRRRRGVWFLAVVSVLFFLFALSYIFAKATVTINPKMENVSLNENLSAEKGASGNALSFDLIVISGEESKNAAATEQKELLQKAKGRVLLYNSFSTMPQTLDIDTRLEGSNGKMYKTDAKSVIPGMSKDGKPGSVEVGIYAAEPGEAGNSAPLDFKIFGFKGTPKYTKFYGRSKGDITGGLTGQFPFISDEQKSKLGEEMKVSLQNKLVKKATDQIPDGFVLFKDAVFLNTEPMVLDYASAKGTSIPVKEKGTLYGLIFNESKLAKKIAAEVIEKYDGADVYIQDMRNLTFSLANKENISFSDVKNINFNISGGTKVVWKVDTDKFLSDIVSKPKKDFNQILLKYPNIESSNLVLSPFWKMYIPDKKTDIKLTVNYPK